MRLLYLLISDETIMYPLISDETNVSSHMRLRSPNINETMYPLISE